MIHREDLLNEDGPVRPAHLGGQQVFILRDDKVALVGNQSSVGEEEAES